MSDRTSCVKHSRSDHNGLICRKGFLLVAVLSLLLLCGCGKQKSSYPVQASPVLSEAVPAADEESGTPAAAGIDPAPMRTEVPQAQAGPAGAVSAAEGDRGFRVLNTVGTTYFEHDYGFSENRAWVRCDTLEYALIDPDGEIIYEIPATVSIEGSSYPVYWSEITDPGHVSGFHPVRNGVTYIRGLVNSRYDVSVIIDADGNELARFIGTDDAQCYIAGRTDDRFLLVYKDLSGAEGRFYCIPIGLDGKAADVPRLIADRNIDQWHGTVCDLGEGVFLLDALEEFYAFYNLNNNTVQRSVSWEGNDPDARFYNGTALTNGYLLTADMLQEDRRNLVLTDYAGKIEGSSSHLYQNGRVWCSGYSYYDRYVGLFDQNGSKINVPDEIGNGDTAFLQASDDGYVLLIEEASTGKKLLSMMGPDNGFLYTRKVFPEDFYPEIGRGGYVLAYNKNREYSILDRDGALHSLRDDLSALPGLSELRFMGVGSGCLLETEQHLDIGTHSDSVALIRSLDGRRQIASVKRTSRTRMMSETLANDSFIDLSRATPVGTAGRSAAAPTTTEDEIRSMGEVGVIVVDRLPDYDRDVLLFERDGVSIVWHFIPNGWCFTVSNGNMENREVSVSSSEAVFYDGIYLDDLRGTARSITLDSGESGEVFQTVVDSEEMFMAEMSRISPGLAELPLDEIIFHFTVQIGSSADPVGYTRILRTSRYSEDGLKALYGDPVGDFEVEGELIYSVYRIRDEAANVFAVRNRMGRDLSATHYMFYARCQWYVNGEEYGGSFEVPIPSEGTGFVSFSNIDSVYKKLELPNGTPIDLELSIPVPGEEGSGTVMRIDLGQIGS